LKYTVEEADLDNNPDTRDNVIVYSDGDLGKIYSIDGCQLTSGQKAEAQLEARQARIDKRYAPQNPYASYPAESMEHLANIVGLKNRGIKFNSDLNSANTAQIWLSKKLSNAPSEAARQEILKYAVEEADLDNNPDTRDNVIVYSDKDLGKILSIDGYQLTSGQKK
jgi:beta-mannanase